METNCQVPDDLTFYHPCMILDYSASFSHVTTNTPTYIQRVHYCQGLGKQGGSGAAIFASGYCPYSCYFVEKSLDYFFFFFTRLF